MNDFKNLEYLVMQSDQGQIVVRGYAIDNGYLYKQVHDRSDNTTTYYRAIIDENSETWFEPQNSILPDVGEWQEWNKGKYHITDDCGYDEIIESDGDMEHVKEWCVEQWQDCTWDTRCLITVTIQQLGWGNDVILRDDIEIECGEDPTPPDCVEGEEHEWTSPYDVVGGLKENPGVWSMGGTTMVTKQVCSHCGCLRVETHYGSQRNPGQCDTVKYDDNDEECLAWAEKQKAKGAN